MARHPHHIERGGRRVGGRGSGRGDGRDDGWEDAHNDDTHSLNEPEALV